MKTRRHTIPKWPTHDLFEAAERILEMPSYVAVGKQMDLLKTFCLFVNLFLQMFEPPVSFIESKKQKTSFEDIDGSKVIAYLEKHSPGSYKLTMSS